MSCGVANVRLRQLISPASVLLIGLVAGLLVFRNAGFTKDAGVARQTAPADLDGEINRSLPESLAGCRDVTSRFRGVQLDTDDRASLVFHGILALGSELSVVNRLTGQPVEIPGFALSLLEASRRGQSADTATRANVQQKHPGQFLSYLLTAKSQGRLHWPEELDSALTAVWCEERQSVGMTATLGWFVPAYCLSDSRTTFSNKYGEVIDAPYLVKALIAQSRDGDRRQVCFGLHEVQALGVARTNLRAELDKATFAILDQVFREQSQEVLAAVSAGQLHAGRSTDNDALRLDDDYSFFYSAGHAIEALVSAPDCVMADPRMHEFVATVLERCRNSTIWHEPNELKTGGSPPGAHYCIMSHLVHALQLYASTVEHRGATAATNH